MSADLSILFFLLLFLVAFLYASVGHGGASGYLALMAIYGVAPEVMKPTALILNLFVSLTAFIQFYRGGHLRWSVFWPLALASVPLAFVGGMMDIDASVYRKILGVLLLVPIVRFLFFPNVRTEQLREASKPVSLVIGGGIGFLSGLIGIGGGILLSPVLLLLRWTDQKQTAAISALFIFVNSLSGLFGQITRGVDFTGDMLMFAAVAFVGGFLGAYFGSLKFNQNVLKTVLALVLIIASYKLIWTS